MMRSCVAWTISCLALVIFESGCGGGAGEKRYVPSASSARQALETALNSWQRGEPPGKIEIAGNSIEVVDSKRQAAQKLTHFEIVKEDGESGPRWFTVRLTLDGSDAGSEARYAVVGRDPIWVFREEDYRQMESM